MYAWLAGRLPRSLADALAVAWYAALLGLVYALWSAPQAAFRYINL